MTVQRVNTRNQLHGTVVQIHSSAVVSEVEIETPGGLISALVTTTSLQAMGLRIGDPAVGLFKAADVLVGKIDEAGHVRSDP